MKKLTVASIALALVAVVSSAFAQPPAGPAPEARGACQGHRGQHGARGERQAAEASGTIARFVEGREGRVRGFVLADGTTVRTRRGAEVLRVGQSVRVSGFTFANAPERWIVRATVRDANGNVLLEPPARGAWRGHRGGHDRDEDR
ncbi:MAG: hypothetical protein U0325_06290 [Polyangiales bacterium]